MTGNGSRPIERALETPELVVAHLGVKERYVGCATLAAGRHTEARRHFRRALAQDADSPTLRAKNHLSIARTFGRAHDVTSAQHAAERARELATRLGLASIEQDSVLVTRV